MAIIISKNGRNAEKVEQSVFGLEDKLQEYIYNNPDSIPLYDIDEDTRLFIAAREFGTKSGPIDALGFDINGNIYVVETKLFKNPDKRIVVAQALDYGASLWRNAVDFEEFVAQLNVHCEKQFGSSFTDKYAEFFSLAETAENLLNIRNNLADGVIKFVVLMDKLHDALKDLVIFVNQNSKFDLYAVELEYYKHAEFEVVIPKLFGAEVKKDVVSARSKSGQKYMTPSSAEEYWEFVDNHFEQKEFDAVARETMNELAELYARLAQKTGGRIAYWRAKTDLREVVKLIVNDADDKVAINLDSDSSFGAYLYDKSGPLIDFARNLQQRLLEAKIMKRTEKHMQASQWFVNLKSVYATDDEIKAFARLSKSASDSLRA